MKCGLCGSGMTLNGGKYACSGDRERGTCSNGKIIAAQTVERRVIEGIRNHLLAPKAITQALSDFRQRADAERKEILASRAPIERELAEIERKLARARDMFLNEMMEMPELEALTAGIKARKSELERKLASVESPSVIVQHPAAAEAYGLLAQRLHEVFEGEDGEEIVGEVRKLSASTSSHWPASENSISRCTAN